MKNLLYATTLLLLWACNPQPKKAEESSEHQDHSAHAEQPSESESKPKSPKKRESFDLPNHEETFVTVASDPEAPFTQVQAMYKDDHERLLDEIRDIMDDYEEDAYFSDEEFASCVEGWFTGHFKTKDSRLHKQLGK